MKYCENLGSLTSMANCTVATCHNYYRKTEDKGIMYHRFPASPTLSKIWISKCKRKDYINVKSARVCSDHFIPSDYKDGLRLPGQTEKKVLKADAVPSVNLPLQDNGEDFSRSETNRKRNILQDAQTRLNYPSPKKACETPAMEPFTSSTENENLPIPENNSFSTTGEMVRVFIKRTDDSPDNKNWICERIDDAPESEPTKKTSRGPSESLSPDGGNSNEESESLYHKVSTYLEVEMKEVENPHLSCDSSSENTTNILETQNATRSHGTTDSSRNSHSAAIDLSGSYSKPNSQRDVTNNVTYKSPIEAHSSKDKFLDNVYGDFRNKPSLTGPGRMIQGEAASSFPKAMRFQNAFLSPNQSQMNSGEVLATAMRTNPSTNQNFSMTIHRNSPIANGIANSEISEILAKGNIPNHLQQEASRPLNSNHRRISTDAQSYGHSSLAPNSDANKSYILPLESETNANGPSKRDEFSEGMGENWVNNLPQRSENYRKRLSPTCAQIGNSDALESVCKPKRKKSHTKAPDNIYCNVCDITLKKSSSYDRHIHSEKHLRKANKAVQQQPSACNFQPNIVSRPSGPTGFEMQTNPYYFYATQNQIMYHQMLQAHARAAVNQSGDDRTIINNTDAKKSNPGTSKPNCNEVPLVYNRSQNHLEAKYCAQDPRLLNHSSNPQDYFLLPRHDQSEKSTMANQIYLGNNAPQSIRCHKDPSSKIQSVNSSNLRCALKPNQLENVTVAGSLQNSGDVQAVSCHQLEFLQIYHCLVCSTFQTDNLEELNQHISIIRRKIPFEMLTVSGTTLFCKLCDFEAQFSVEMGHHCEGIVHLNRVDYYNHVMEGGICTEQKLKNFDEFSPVYLLCSACEFITKSMDTLKAHSIDPNHIYNVSCCMHVSKFSPEVAYCYCRPCKVRTLTKRELLIHARSRKHMNNIRHYDGTFVDPSMLFVIEEFSLNGNDLPRVTTQTEGSTCNERGRPHLRTETNEKNDFSENPVPLNLSSAPSNPLKTQPVSCTLCQKTLPEVNALIQHLQQIHGVNEAGVKWLISTLPTEEPTNTKSSKSKSIVFSPQEFSTPDKKLPILGVSMDSSSSQSFVARQNLESKSPLSHKAFTSEKNMAMGDNLNQEEKAGTDFSCEQLYKTECMKNLNSLGRNSEVKTAKDFSSSQQPWETECLQNPARSRTDSFAGQQFYEKGLQNSEEPNQSPDFDQKRVNINPPLNLQFHKTECIPHAEEGKVSNLEENLNSSSSEAEVIEEKESETNGDNRFETIADDSFSEQFSATTHGLTIPTSDHNAGKENNDSLSSNYNPPQQQYYKTETAASLEENLNSSSSEAEVIDEYWSEPNIDGSNETETYDSSSEHFSATEHRLAITQSNNVSRERNDSSSSEISSATPERLLAIYDCQREHFLETERKPPKPRSSIKPCAKRINFSSSDDIFREKVEGRNSSPIQSDVLVSENRRSPLGNQENLNLGENTVNDSLIGIRTALVEPKEEADNISVENKNSVHGEIVLYDCSNEHKEEFSASNSSVPIDPQVQARKNIENIEISGVFSLASPNGKSSNTNSEGESFDFEGISFSDKEEL